jgi:plastocyanin
MKRIITIVTLILAISASMVAATFSLYTVSIPNLAEGSVVAKEFILLENGEDTFKENVKIAPGEEVAWEFSVKNHNDGVVSETAMDLDFEVEVEAAAGKDAILPLVVTVSEVIDSENVQQVGTKTGIGKIEFDDEFELETTGQEKTYEVVINWPSDDEEDFKYIGAGFGTAVKVSVTGTQK